MTTQFTTKLRLATPDTGSYNWEYFWLGNMRIIDNNVPRVFQNAPYVVGVVPDAAAGSLTAGHYYYYKVIAYDSGGTLITFASAESIYGYMDPGPGYKENVVSWSAVAGASKYSLYRADVATLTVPPADASYFWIADITSPTTTYTDTGAAAGGAMPTVATWLVTEIDQRYIMPDTTEAQTFDTLGAASTLVNNLNRARYMLQAVNGQTNWYTLPTTNLYMITNGKSGGQTFTGGTAASQNLTLQSTAHATKGYILLNPSGGYVGIATASPTARLEIGPGTGAEQVRINAGGGNSADLILQSNGSVSSGSVTFHDGSTAFAEVFGTKSGGVSLLRFYVNSGLQATIASDGSLTTAGDIKISGATPTIWHAATTLNIKSETDALNSVVVHGTTTYQGEVKVYTAADGNIHTYLSSGISYFSDSLAVGAVTNRFYKLNIEQDGQQLRLSTVSSPTNYYTSLSAANDASNPFTLNVARAGVVLELISAYHSGGGNPYTYMNYGSLGIGRVPNPATYKLEVEGGAYINGALVATGNITGLNVQRYAARGWCNTVYAIGVNTWAEVNHMDFTNKRPPAGAGDPQDGYNLDSNFTISGNQITIPVDGYYLIEVSVGFNDVSAGSAGSYYAASCHRSYHGVGSWHSLCAQQLTFQSDNVNVVATTSDVRYLLATDKLALYAFASSGDTKTINILADGFTTFIAVTFLTK